MSYRALEEWRDRRACGDLDPNLFFPNMNDVQAIKAAKAICSSCEVRVDCQQYALATKQPDGIWGGLDEEQRRKVLQTRRKMGNITYLGMPQSARAVDIVKNTEGLL